MTNQNCWKSMLIQIFMGNHNVNTTYLGCAWIEIFEDEYKIHNSKFIDGCLD